MKFFMSGLLVMLSMGLMGCLETSYSYHLCDASNRVWLPQLSEGAYELKTANGGTIGQYFTKRTDSAGIYFVTAQDDTTGDLADFAYLAQTCELEGKTYLEVQFGESGHDLGLIQITAVGNEAWALQLMEPNLDQVEAAKIPIEKRSLPDRFLGKRYIYNFPNSYEKLSPRLFNFSNHKYAPVSLTKKK